MASTINSSPSFVSITKDRPHIRSWLRVEDESTIGHHYDERQAVWYNHASSEKNVMSITKMNSGKYIRFYWMLLTVDKLNGDHGIEG